MGHVWLIWVWLRNPRAWSIGGLLEGRITLVCLNKRWSSCWYILASKTDPRSTIWRPCLRSWRHTWKLALRSGPISQISQFRAHISKRWLYICSQISLRWLWNLLGPWSWKGLAFSWLILSVNACWGPRIWNNWRKMTLIRFDLLQSLRIFCISLMIIWLIFGVSFNAFRSFYSLFLTWLQIALTKDFFYFCLVQVRFQLTTLVLGLVSAQSFLIFLVRFLDSRLILS